MADIRMRLLGDVNSYLRGQPGNLVPKYIATITAENLAGLLKYRRQKGKHPIRLEPDSIIKVDADIQRGVTDAGTLRQEEKKIDEIRNALLGAKGAAPKIFLGSLIWNIRETGKGVFRDLQVSEEGQRPEYELAIKASAIYLTDSAHRHFGIAEAYRAYSLNPAKYPDFKPNLEFSVEIYNLDRNGEKLLFNELNSKQKKITATKIQQLDTTSDIGVLKDRISTVDFEDGRLLYQNIEVNSNQNDRHTLMTMSVFTASVREMFGTALISEAKSDSELCDELAEYYCEYLYKLHSTIRTVVTINGIATTVAPFSNLYTEIIDPAENEAASLDEDAAEQVRQTARERAKQKNSDVRAVEKIHSNSFIRGLFWLGGQIRLMKNWTSVVDQIQLSLIASSGGKYFQSGNQKLLEVNQKGVAIGTIKEDGSLNIQVQSHTIAAIKQLLLRELDLELPSEMYYRDATSGTTHLLSDSEQQKVVVLSRTTPNRIEMQYDFVVASNVIVDKSTLRLKVTTDLDGAGWKEVEKKGEKRLVAHDITLVEGWLHPVYSDGLRKYTSTFVLEPGPFHPKHTTSFGIKLELAGYDLGGNQVVESFTLRCQAH